MGAATAVAISMRDDTSLSSMSGLLVFCCSCCPSCCIVAIALPFLIRTRLNPVQRGWELGSWTPHRCSLLLVFADSVRRQLLLPSSAAAVILLESPSNA